MPQPPQWTCAIWLAVETGASRTHESGARSDWWPLAHGARGYAPCIARLTVLHTEHCTLEAPLMYISSVLQPPHSSWAISVPAGGTGVTLLHSAHRTLEAPCGRGGPHVWALSAQWHTGQRSGCRQCSCATPGGRTAASRSRSK